MDINRIKRIDNLIRLKVGNAETIGNALGVSERTVYKYINFMKIELKAPIHFDKENARYSYENDGKLEFKWKGK